MNIQNYISILKLTGLFDDFSTEKLIDLFEKNSYIISQYKKNSIIHFESEICEVLDIVLKGQIIIQKIDQKGNVLTITEFRTSDTIGGNLLFSNHPYYPMSILAKTDVEVLHIKKNLIMQLCQKSESFLISFLSSISDKTAILTNKIKSISMKSIRESIIHFLNIEYYTQKNSEINLNMTKKELAEKLGIQRTSLSRELNKMKKDGLIDYNAHTILINNFDIIHKLD